MSNREQKNPSDVPAGRGERGQTPTPPKFRSTKSKSSREIFYLAITLASLIRIVMQFVHR